MSNTDQTSTDKIMPLDLYYPCDALSAAQIDEVTKVAIASRALSFVKEFKEALARKLQFLDPLDAHHFLTEVSWTNAALLDHHLSELGHFRSSLQISPSSS